MSKEMTVALELRKETGKGFSKRLRKMGRIPAIVYGRGTKSIPVAMDPEKLKEILSSETGENTIFSMSISGEKEKSKGMIKDFQLDPVTDEIVHADLILIDIKKTIEVNVPIHLVGTPVGVKEQGGILDFIIREVRISCLPTDIPERIDLDVSHLSIGHHLNISDIKIAKEIKILDDPQRTVVVVSPPKVEEVAVPVEAAEEAEEPEVLKKGKEEAEEKEAKKEEKKMEEAKDREKEKDKREKKEK